MPSIQITADKTPSSFSATDYFEFTLTPNSGSKINLDNLTFQYAESGNNNTANFVVRSSKDSFASDLAPSVSSSSSTFATKVIDLSTASSFGNQFQNLTSAVTFRIYIWDTGNNSGNSNRLDLLDNIILNGDLAAVPEPSTYGMMGLGVGLLAAVQRFRRRR